MPDPRTLLASAARVYDDSEALQSPFRFGAGFEGGARWMAAALEALRGQPVTGRCRGAWGYLKYGLATAASIATMLLAWALDTPWLLVLVPVAFYAMEAQMVFLFPLTLDGATRPITSSLRHTRRAGGTLRVMATVIPIAASMVLGGLVGRGFLRSWCVGCLAVCVWYETIRSPEQV